MYKLLRNVSRFLEITSQYIIMILYAWWQCSSQESDLYSNWICIYHTNAIFNTVRWYAEHMDRCQVNFFSEKLFFFFPCVCIKTAGLYLHIISEPFLLVYNLTVLMLAIFGSLLFCSPLHLTLRALYTPPHPPLVQLWSTLMFSTVPSLMQYFVY